MNYQLIAIGVGIYALSCVCPLLAKRADEPMLRGYLAVLDAIFDISGWICIWYGLGGGWWTAAWLTLGAFTLGAVYRSALPDDYLNPYTRKPIRKSKESTLVE